MSKDKKNEIAFKDFKKSISIGEFEAVLAIATQEYDQMKEVSNKHAEFLSKIKKDIHNDNEMPVELSRKISEGIVRKGNRELSRMFSEQISRTKELTDFINRFKDPENLLPYLEFNI
tara:strand:+ start:144 stop:494 length:351 start_codon:yes stop_codon:yes gene_type:complete